MGVKEGHAESSCAILRISSLIGKKEEEYL